MNAPARAAFTNIWIAPCIVIYLKISSSISTLLFVQLLVYSIVFYFILTRVYW